MTIEKVRIADVAANDPALMKIHDARARLGFVTVACPLGGVEGQHLLYICNPLPERGQVARLFCSAPECRHVSSQQFIDLLSFISLPADGQG